MSEAESVESKRKRQDSINKSQVTDEIVTPEAEPHSKQHQPRTQQSQRPRTSEDGEENTSGSEEANVATKSVKAIELDQKDKKEPVAAAATPVFGSRFGFGMGGFASAAKKASPFAAFTSGAMSSGFAKYAAKKEEPMGDSADEGSSSAGRAIPRGLPDTHLPYNPHCALRPRPHFRRGRDLPVHDKGQALCACCGQLEGARRRPVKINRHNENHARRRMVMRTDLTFRLILNSPMFSGMKAECERKFVRFGCIDAETKLPTTLALRFPNEAAAASAHAAIVENIPRDVAEETLPKEDSKEETEGGESGSEASESAVSSRGRSRGRRRGEELDSENEADNSEDDADGQKKAGPNSQ
ncbi:hypothetical protein BX661DRAFT_171928 [Kickxella alabastrina]|uniref:uncharacterized protein n=1 Tax=Kickxella alabastrina TaxID=61397 RepID=UPI00221F9B5B|nr:uncharacterized protein BX661DRAFT_171928 [Kickxella alabastrina]KAI7825416.1 hypothetical protein BX661DRAFT_171928 [Kickxella alabastrina]